MNLANKPTMTLSLTSVNSPGVAIFHVLIVGVGRCWPRNEMGMKWDK